MKSNKSLEKLFKQLDGLEKAIRGKAIRKGLRAGGKVLASQVKSNAPVASGRTKRSVKVRAGKRQKNSISTTVEVTGGHDEPFIGFVEFGTKEQAANPFIRKSVAARRDDVVGSVFDAIEAAINETIKG